MNCNRYKILFTAMFFTLFITQTNIFGMKKQTADDIIKQYIQNENKTLKKLRELYQSKPQIHPQRRWL